MLDQFCVCIRRAVTGRPQNSDLVNNECTTLFVLQLVNVNTTFTVVTPRIQFDPRLFNMEQALLAVSDTHPPTRTISCHHSISSATRICVFRPGSDGCADISGRVKRLATNRSRQAKSATMPRTVQLSLSRSFVPIASFPITPTISRTAFQQFNGAVRQLVTLLPSESRSGPVFGMASKKTENQRRFSIEG